MLSLLLLVVDANTRLLAPARGFIGTLVSPLFYIANTPYQVSAGVGETLASRQSLQDQNRRLQSQLLELSLLSQQYVALQEENARLRNLLGSRARVEDAVLVAEIIGQRPSPHRHHLILDKGASAGVFPGQAVIDAAGLFGQIIEVAQFSSVVMLLTDNLHAVPVQVLRNGFRSIVNGTGEPDYLELEYVPVTADIVVGDLLLSSGMGGRFPPGYPVAEVTQVEADPRFTYMQVQARPLAALDRTRHVLLLFPQEAAQERAMQEAAP